MDRCAICEKSATEHCTQCGMALCDNHITHGLQFRTNDPVINCPNCKKKAGKKSNKLMILMSVVFVIIIISTILVMNSVFSFLR